MGQTAIVSPQIIDSTSIGRDLITAADQAAAQAIIGVTGVDTGEDYTWTGDHTFDGSVTFTGPFDAVDGDFSGDINFIGNSYIKRNDVNMLRFGSGLSAYAEFTPGFDNTYSCGSDTFRWTNVYSVDGSFSGNLTSEVGGSYKLYNLGTEGDADTEYLELSWAANKAYLVATETGTGIARDLVIDSGSSVRVAYNGNERILFTNTELRPVIDNYTSLGTSTRRYSNTYSVNGDFSGTLSAVTVAGQTNNLTLQSNNGSALISLAESGSVSLTAYSSIYQQFTNIGVGYRQNCYPIFSTLDLGSAATPWNNGYFNNLSSAVGGSYKLYNLGTDGDADTEYLEIAQGTFTGYGIYANATGSGAVNKQIEILTNARKSGSVIKADSIEFYANSSSFAKLAVQNASTYTRQDFRPHTTGNYSCGTTTYRWSNVASVDGDFSGTVTVDGDVEAEYVTGLNGRATDANLWFRPDFGQLFIKSGASNVARFASTGILFYADCTPQTSGQYDLGSSNQRWGSVVSIDGSFSSNLNVEVGGSYKLYNLGTDGDADTEYLETFWDTNKCVIQPKKTGTGANRSLELRSPTGQAYLNLGFNGNGSIGHNTVLTAFWGSSYFRFGVQVEPNANGTVDLGTTSLRWSNVASVDGDFSGTMTLSNLPTSDPAVAGQLWNDSGTVKISAG